MGIDDIVRKAKEAATDERIDQASEQLRKVTPDNIDRHVETAAEHAKKYNEDEPATPGAAERPAATSRADERPAAAPRREPPTTGQP